MRNPIGRIGGWLRGAPRFTGDARRACESAWPLFAPALTRVAERMTDDKDEREDLLQEAMIALWNADPTRFDLRDPLDMRYLEKILVHRMWKVWGGKKNRLRETTDDSE